MEQKVPCTLIRWTALKGRQVGLQFNDEPNWYLVNVRRLTLRLQFVHPNIATLDPHNSIHDTIIRPVKEFLEKRLECVVLDGEIITRPTLRRGVYADRANEVKHANGMIVPLMPETINFVKFSLWKDTTDDRLFLEEVRFPSVHDILSASNQNLVYADLEPRSYRDLVDWNLRNIMGDISPPCVVKKPQSNVVSVRDIQELHAMLIDKPSSSDSEQLIIPMNVEYAVCIGTVMQSNERELWNTNRAADVVFHATIKTQRTAHQEDAKNARCATLHIALPKAIENLQNARWSLEEFGMPSEEQLTTLTNFACSVASITHTPLGDVFEKGPLALATSFIDYCCEKMGVVPYSTMVLHQRYASDAGVGSINKTKAATLDGDERSAGETTTSYQGGKVMDAAIGLYTSAALPNPEANPERTGDLTLLDFDSYYPSIILEHQLFYTPFGSSDDMPVNHFHKLLKIMLEKKRMTQITPAHVIKGIKFIINAMYGSFGSERGTVKNITDVASKITQTGRTLLQDIAVIAREQYLAHVLQGHTDSIMIMTPTRTISDSICNHKDTLSTYKYIRLRPSKHYDMVWILNKTHHISLVECDPLDISEFMLAMDKLVTDMCTPQHAISPAMLLRLFLESKKNVIHAPGMLASTMPPAVQVLHIIVASLLLFGWAGHADHADRFMEWGKKLCEVERVNAAAWHHYIDQETIQGGDGAHVKKAVQPSGGVTDSNYRSHLVETWNNKATRFIPVIRSTRSQSYALPDPNEKTAVDADFVWWLQRLYRTFSGYLNLEEHQTKKCLLSVPQFTKGMQLLDQCLETFSGVKGIQNQQWNGERPTLASNQMRLRAVATANLDVFVGDYGMLCNEWAPDYKDWIAWSFNFEERSPPATLTRWHDSEGKKAFTHVFWRNIFDSLTLKRPEGAKHIVNALVFERFVLPYNLDDMLTRTMRPETASRYDIERAYKRLKQEGLVDEIRDVYFQGIQAYTQWNAV